MSGNTGAGTFTATCFEILQLSGSAHGTVVGTTVNWTAVATATGPAGVSSCAISLTSSAQLNGDEIEIPYSGTTCLGDVSGTERLRKS
jgi:hypothetical protein